MLPFSSTKPLKPPFPFPPSLYTLSPSVSLHFSPIHSFRNPTPRLRILSLDAAQPFDYETQFKSQYLKSNALKIAVVGFGNFGQFLSKAILRHGHTVLAHSRSDYSLSAADLGVSFFRDPNDLCEEHPEVVLLSTSILSTEKVLANFPFQRLRRNTLFVDVLSVKEFPRNLMVKYLPQEFDILCAHPMFGPESGKDSWAGLPFVFDKVRIGNDPYKLGRCQKFLSIFEKEGCRMVEMSCAEHDKYAAGSQFVTHTMGRVLEKFGLESSPINTKGYETLLNLVDNTAGDSFDLYYGLFMYNKNALEQLQKLDMAFESIKKDLFGQLHHVCRDQFFGKSVERPIRYLEQKLLTNGSPVEAPSMEICREER